MAKNHSIFYYNLSTMLDSGIPVVRSLEIASQSSHSEMKKTLSKIEETVRQGNTLYEAMAMHPKAFSHFDLAAINAAERAGGLAEVLKILADWHEFAKKIKNRILSGLLFPAAILVIAAIVAPLPFLILRSYTFSEAIGESIRILSIFTVPALLIYAIVKFTPKTGFPRYIIDLMSLRIPFLGKALRYLAVSRYCSTFYILTKAGVPVIETAAAATDACTNAVIADRLRGGAVCARKGQPISEGFKEPITEGFIDLWKVGEESGQTEQVVKKLADLNAESALFKFEQFSYWLPRFIYALICLMVIYLIFRNYSSIYGNLLNQSY